MGGVLDADDIDGFAELMESMGMPDTCRVLRVAAAPTVDAYGYGTSGFTTENVTVACAYQATQNTERDRDTTEVRVNTAQLFLPLSTVISNRDQVELTHRFGRAVSPPWRFRILGDPVDKVVALVMSVERVFP